MDYFDSFEDMKKLFLDYSNIIPPEKIVIGVKAGTDFTLFRYCRKNMHLE